MFKFTGKCRYHGETDFNKKGCIKCNNAKRAIYRVYKRKENGVIKYYTVGNKEITDMKINYMFPFLCKRRITIAKKFITRVTKGPGTYGIFVINYKATSGSNLAQKYLGKCLYVGQSVNVKARVADHLNKINVARKDKDKLLCQFPYPKIPTMYYNLAKYPKERIKIVKLTSIDSTTSRKMSKEELFESLVYLEQWGMDCFNPEYNVTAARRTDINY